MNSCAYKILPDYYFLGSNGCGNQTLNQERASTVFPADAKSQNVTSTGELPLSLLDSGMKEALNVIRNPF